MPECQYRGTAGLLGGNKTKSGRFFVVVVVLGFYENIQVTGSIFDS